MTTPSRQLRILSIVTLVSLLGEYGGPVRVAVNQANALRELGHDVTIAGGVRGYGRVLPTTINGVPAKLFRASTLVPRTGFAGLTAPGLWRWFRRHARDYDVVHLHAARDLVTLPVGWLARRQGVPYVVQAHGMIDPSSNPLAAPLDAVLTRAVLRGAAHVLYLTDEEAAGVRTVAGERLETVHLPNGVPTQEVAPLRESPVVLYLARLAPRKRPQYFVEAAVRLGRRHPRATFVMVGPDEGEGQSVRRAIAEATAAGVSISWAGAVAPEATEAQMLAASIYVLPSVDEPYPMSVLEAMAVGVPVVITATCGLATVVTEANAGIVVDDSCEALVDAIDYLLEEPARSRAMGLDGRAYVQEHLSMTSIARQLESLYVG